jgi:hypothetical protein
LFDRFNLPYQDLNIVRLICNIEESTYQYSGTDAIYTGSLLSTDPERLLFFRCGPSLARICDRNAKGARLKLNCDGVFAIIYFRKV